MSEGYKALKEIGAQKIHEATHISKVHVEAVLHDSFDGMSKVQLFGFISILEREYAVDLSDLKNKAIEYFDENKEDYDDKESVKALLSSKKKINLTLFYIAIVVVIFASFMLLNINSSQGEVSEVIKVDNSAIESAKNNLSTVVVVDTAKSEDINSSVAEEEPQKEKEIRSFKIIPNIEVWLGYIDLQTYKRHQKIFENEFDLDPSKDWLLAFGHGHINIEINGVIKEYKIKKNVRFVYKNGELKQIDFEEFKSLNRGSKW